MPDINIHAGCHGIFETAAYFLFEKRASISEISESRLITQNEFRLNWRPFMLSGETKSLVSAKETKLTKEVASATDGLFVLSSPRIMGSDKSIMEKKVIYPDAGRRIANLTKIFDGCDVVVKIFIIEINTFSSLANIKVPRLGYLDQHPWADLARRVENSNPTAKIEIYAVDDPYKFSSHLAEILFEPGIKRTPAVNDVQEEAFEDFLSKVSSIPNGAEIDFYHADLEVINSMSGVSLHVI